ncbi:MAG: hypothetical protein JXB15_08645 [Anaerolineales bacterium]|nr:hypothetical protein [Anaerolineales bacterium]
MKLLSSQGMPLRKFDLLSPDVSRRAGDRLFWRIFFLLAALQGLGALAFLLTVRSESGLLFGLSGERLVIAAGILALTLAFGWRLLQTWLKPQALQSQLERLSARLERPGSWNRALAGLLLLLITGAYLITLTPDVAEPFARSYFERLLPVIVLATGLCTQTLVVLLVMRYRLSDLRGLRAPRSFCLPLAVFALVFLVWALIVRAAPGGESLLHQESQRTGWNVLGAPLLETQLLLAWLAGLLMLALDLAIDRRAPQTGRAVRLLDLAIFLLLWVGAILLWQGIPLLPNWFVAELRPPNFEPYPISDARNYDTTAQLALVGEGFQFFQTPFIRRPMHALYLTALHLTAGQDYNRVISLQIILLALIPPLLYLLTKALHQRASALIAALLVLLREGNSIAIGSRITTSHAKLLMADLPATLAVLGLTLAAVIWAKHSFTAPHGGPNAARTAGGLAVLSGGLLGIAMLIRAEIFVLFFALALVVWFSLRGAAGRRLAAWLKALLLILLGLALVIAPWVWRNWQLTGMIFLDSPYWRSDLIIQRFHQTPTPASQPDPASTPGAAAPTVALATPGPAPQPSPAASPAASTLVSATSTPVPLPPSSGSAIQQALRAIARDPGQTAASMLAHYLNSQMQTFLVLPTSLRIFDSFTSYLGNQSPEKLWYDCCSALGYIRRMPYWRKWNGAFPFQAMLPLVGNLSLIALGIHLAWKKHRHIGLLPLAYNLIYLLFNALFRNSGGRYILPVDWVGILYFSIGLAGATAWALQRLRRGAAQSIAAPLHQAEPALPPAQTRLLRSPLFYLAALSLLLVGLSLALTESAFPQRYTAERRDAMVMSLVQSDLLSAEQHQYLQNFFTQDNKLVIAGRALYPQFLAANVGDSPRDILRPEPYPRLGFFLAGPVSYTLTLPLSEHPDYLPNASDVLVIGCQDYSLLLVALFDPAGSLQSVWFRHPLPANPACPFPAE